KALLPELSDAWARLDACGADPELVRLAKACLAAQPAGRPRDAGVVAHAVTAHLAGVAERLREAELAQTAALTQAAEAGRARRLAEQVAAPERRARRLTAALAASVLLTLLLGRAAGAGLARDA